MSHAGFRWQFNQLGGTWAFIRWRDSAHKPLASPERRYLTGAQRAPPVGPATSEIYTNRTTLHRRRPGVRD